MLIPNAKPVGELSEGITVVPESSYNLRVHKAEYVAIPKRKESKGPYIKTQLVITGPGDNAYIGRYVFMNYSLTGDGSFRLRELLEVTGHATDFQLENTDQLLGLEFGAAVIIQAGTEGYTDKNQVRKHLPLLEAA